MEAIRALNLIETFEEHMFLLYDSWARAFAAREPAAAELFQKLKRDELGHKMLAVKQRETIVKSPGSGGKDVIMDLMVMDRTIDNIKQYIVMPPATLRRALELAYSFESSAAEQYIIGALREMGGEVGALIDGYTEEFSEHFSKLLDFIRLQRLAPISPEHDRLVLLRVPYASPVILDGSISARGSNLSEQGAMLLCEAAFQKGQETALRLPLESVVLEIKAVVRNVQPGRSIGVQFTGLSEADSAALRAYVDKAMTGEKVTCLLPEAPEEEKPAARPARPAGKGRVLIMNNSVFSSSDLQMFVAALRDEGVEVIEFATAQALMDRLSEGDNDRAVIVAAETVNDEGFPLLGRIKRDPRFGGLPILVLSTSFDKKFINRVLSYGASFAHKMNLTPEQLLSFIRPE